MAGVIPIPEAEHVIFRRATDGYLLTVVEEGKHLKFTDSPSTDRAVQFALAPKEYPTEGCSYTIQSRLTKNWLFRDPSDRDRVRADLKLPVVIDDAKFIFERPGDPTLQPYHILLKNVGSKHYCGTPAAGPEMDCLFANVADAGHAVLVGVEEVVLFMRASDGHLLDVVNEGRSLMFRDKPTNDIAVQFIITRCSGYYTIRSGLTNNLLIRDPSDIIRADRVITIVTDDAKFYFEGVEDKLIVLRNVGNDKYCWSPDYLIANARDKSQAVRMVVKDIAPGPN